MGQPHQVFDDEREAEGPDQHGERAIGDQWADDDALGDAAGERRVGNAEHDADGDWHDEAARHPQHQRQRDVDDDISAEDRKGTKRQVDPLRYRVHQDVAAGEQPIDGADRCRIDQLLTEIGGQAPDNSSRG